MAINPVDAAIQAHGLLWTDFPVTIGSDVAGTIVSVGSSVPASLSFREGDRVIACVERGGFQKFCAADFRVVARIPDRVTFVEGAVLPLAVATAMMGLFLPEALGLDGPGLEVDGKENGKTVVVWGASSAVGSCAVQMSRAAGYEVVAVAGSHNAQYCKELGTSCAFDHRGDSAVEDIISHVKKSGKAFAGVYCAIIAPETIAKCAIIADRLGMDKGSRTVATVMAPGMPFDTSLVPNGVSIDYCAGLLEVLPNSKLGAIMGNPPLRPNQVANQIWGQWLGQALELGIMKCKPDAELVGQGLESVQEACDRMAQGVSAKKLVVEMP